MFSIGDTRHGFRREGVGGEGSEGGCMAPQRTVQAGGAGAGGWVTSSATAVCRTVRGRGTEVSKMAKVTSRGVGRGREGGGKLGGVREGSGTRRIARLSLKPPEIQLARGATTRTRGFKCHCVLCSNVSVQIITTLVFNSFKNCYFKIIIKYNNNNY